MSQRLPEAVSILKLVDRLEAMMLKPVGECYDCEVFGAERSDGHQRCDRCNEVLEISRAIRKVVVHT